MARCLRGGCARFRGRRFPKNDDLYRRGPSASPFSLRRRGAVLLVGVSPGREHRCSDTRACGERERIHFVEKRESDSAILRAETKQAARWAACEIRGANERIRTADLRITSALLYQLSHVGAPLPKKREQELYRMRSDNASSGKRKLARTSREFHALIAKLSVGKAALSLSQAEGRG